MQGGCASDGGEAAVGADAKRAVVRVALSGSDRQLAHGEEPLRLLPIPRLELTAEIGHEHFAIARSQRGKHIVLARSRSQQFAGRQFPDARGLIFSKRQDEFLIGGELRRVNPSRMHQRLEATLARCRVHEMDRVGVAAREVLAVRAEAGLIVVPPHSRQYPVLFSGIEIPQIDAGRFGPRVQDRHRATVSRRPSGENATPTQPSGCTATVPIRCQSSVEDKTTPGDAPPIATRRRGWSIAMEIG